MLLSTHWLSILLCVVMMQRLLSLSCRTLPVRYYIFSTSVFGIKLVGGEKSLGQGLEKGGTYI